MSCAHNNNTGDAVAGCPLTLPNLPSDVLVQFLRFIPDHVGLCYLSSTCRYFRELIASNDTIWESIHDRRWAVGGHPKALLSHPWRQEYVRRHRLDAFAVRGLLEFAEEIASAEPSARYPKFPYRAVWGNRKWGEVLVFGEEVYDGLCNVANDDDTYRPLGASKPTDELRFLAASAAVAINRVEVLKKWGALFQDMSSYEHVEGAEYGRAVEKGALLLVRFHLTADELLSMKSPRSPVRAVEDQLDKIGTSFQERLGRASLNGSSAPPRASSEIDTLSAVRTLNELLFNDMGFTGSRTNYYDFRNSLLDHVLETRQGIPISLAVLYLCVCYRVGIHVDMVGLPGHFLLGIPFSSGQGVSETFIDVFEGGRLLSLNDCREIVQSYGHPWRESMARRVSPVEVLLRMLNNLDVCHHNEKDEYEFSLSYLRCLRMAVAHPNVSEWFSSIPFFVDEKLLLRYGFLENRQ